MPKPKINNKAPIFKGDCTGGKEISLSELLGKNVVLYFYPKDSTPGCTTEGQDFRDLKGQFTRANTVIFGLSRESIKSSESANYLVSVCFTFYGIVRRAMFSPYTCIRITRNKLRRIH